MAKDSRGAPKLESALEDWGYSTVSQGRFALP
jgi:hypothetical protein